METFFCTMFLIQFPFSFVCGCTDLLTKATARVKPSPRDTVSKSELLPQFLTTKAQDQKKGTFNLLIYQQNHHSRISFLLTVAQQFKKKTAHLFEALGWSEQLKKRKAWQAHLTQNVKCKMFFHHIRKLLVWRLNQSLKEWLAAYLRFWWQWEGALHLGNPGKRVWVPLLGEQWSSPQQRHPLSFHSKTQG